MRKTLFATATLLIAIAIPSSAQVSRDQARSLVQTTLKLRGDKVPSKQIQETTNDVPGYYSFGAYDQAQGVQNVVGWFAVNKRTGQVWETTSCELYEFPTLEKQRRKYVKRATKAKQKPPCADGQRTHIVRKKSSRRAAELPEVAQ
jgi:hypothetical protein